MPNSSGSNSDDYPKKLLDMDDKEFTTALDADLKHYSKLGRLLDYSELRSFRNVAIYTPAISDGYISSVERLVREQKAALDDNKPEDDPFYELLKDSDYEFGAEDLKFNNPNSKLFFYPWLLFSGGQGARTEPTSKKRDWITDPNRDPRIVLIGDSGGYQIQEQTIPYIANETPERMLRWLEDVADQSMILDFPTGGITTGAMVPHVKKLESEGVPVKALAKSAGFSTGFMACLIRTKQNNRYFTKHRATGKTKLLNVIQGRNEEESAYWFNTIKHFPFEGWSFAGKHSVQLSLTLRRLIQMRDAGLLRNGQWIHFLGVSTLKVGAALTYIQRALREYTDAKDVQITFDSKSPVDSMVQGYNAIAGYDLNLNKWSVRNEPTNIKANIGSDVKLHFLAQEWAGKSPNRILAQSTLSHILTLNDLVGEMGLAKGKRIPNSLQQVLLVNHNTQALIEAFRSAYRFLDLKYAYDRPESIRFLELSINTIFTVEKPFQAIDELETQLDALSFGGFFGK